MFARTERLLLRPGWVDDAPALAEALGDEAIVRNLARVPWPYGTADAEAWLAKSLDPMLPSLLAFARTAGAPRLVGGAGLHRDERGEVALGYWIARPLWGLGYATEAAGAVVDFARALRLPELRAAHFLDNPASGRVLAKLGFEPTGTVPHFSLGRGGEALAREYRLQFDGARSALAFEREVERELVAA
jgi:RimJ/RimL family protein N-acetyltransferase